MQIKREKDLFADLALNPKLEEFLNTLFMKMPSLTFAAHDYTQRIVSHAKLG